MQMLLKLIAVIYITASSIEGITAITIPSASFQAPSIAPSSQKKPQIGSITPLGGENVENPSAFRSATTEINYTHTDDTAAHSNLSDSVKQALIKQSPSSLRVVRPVSGTLSYPQTTTESHYDPQHGRRARRRDIVTKTISEQEPVHTVVVTRVKISSTLGESMSNLRSTETSSQRSTVSTGLGFVGYNTTTLIHPSETVVANNNSKLNTTRVTSLDDVVGQTENTLLHLQRFKLRTKVLYGDSRFDDLTVQDPIHLDQVSIPLLSSKTSTAARFYLDYSTSSLVLCYAELDAVLGLVMVRDHDQDAYGTVQFGREVGTARMEWEQKSDGYLGMLLPAFAQPQSLVWDNDRFGSWLVCQPRSGGVFELKWWDVVTNQGIDEKICARVRLEAISSADASSTDLSVKTL